MFNTELDHILRSMVISISFILNYHNYILVKFLSLVFKVIQKYMTNQYHELLIYNAVELLPAIKLHNCLQQNKI